MTRRRRDACPDDLPRAAQGVVATQKRAAERLRREVLGASGARTPRYFRAFERALRDHEGVARIDDLVLAATLADVVYVGDFHAVPAYQRFAAQLLEQVADRVGRVTLGVEFVYTRQQGLLDRRQRGELDDDAFLRRLHYRDEWGYPWEGFRDLLNAARDRGIAVHALDVAPRGGVSALGRRDEHAARRIAAVLERDPDAHMLVLFGESHLARGHLPRQVKRRLKRVGLERREAVVFQSPDALYWKLVRPDEGPPPAVRVDARSWAVFHTPPLEKYEAYRQNLERWRDDSTGDDEVDLTPAVHHLIGVLLGWLGIKPRRRRLHHRAGWSEELIDAFPEVYSGRDAFELLGPVLAEHGRTKDEQEEARRRLRRRGALYDSRSNTVFLSRYAPGPAAGEGALFVRAALTGRLFTAHRDFAADPVAQAYGAAFNEALAYLGSRLIDPATEYVEPLADQALAAAAGAPPLAATIPVATAEWLERHRAFEATRRRRPDDALLAALRAERSLRRALARDLGARLGRHLFERVRAGELDKLRLSRLFGRRLDAANAMPFVLGLLRR